MLMMHSMLNAIEWRKRERVRKEDGTKKDLQIRRHFPDP